MKKQNQTLTQTGGTVSFAGVVGLCLLAFVVALRLIIGKGPQVVSDNLNVFWLTAMHTFLSESLVLLAVLVSAGGFGFLAIRAFMPSTAPTGLKVTTAIGAGLWMHSTAVLAVGTFSTGLLRQWFWWPVLVLGIVLAAWQARGSIRSLALPERMDGRFLTYVVIAIAVGVMMAGATAPAGSVSLEGDAYDVLEYHLQVPREFYDAQHIDQLPHNVYSYYPSGGEMLYLLAMILRGGPLAGMYAANMIHASFAVLAVIAILTGLRGDERRARFSALLLAVSPLAIYLSWLAMVELAEVFYATIAILWLRQWLASPSHSWRNAAMIGIALGGSCTVKYLSVGFIAAPVAAAMFVAGLRSRRQDDSPAIDESRATLNRRLVGGENTPKQTTLEGGTNNATATPNASDSLPGRMLQVAAAVLLAGLLMSPWLIRNIAYTGNPVFPLATSLFGRGHWTAQQELRWQYGHAMDKHPPVPQPPGWTMPQTPSRLETFVNELITKNLLGAGLMEPILLALVALGILTMFLSPGRTTRWDWCLLAILAMQLAVWAFTSYLMPLRFLSPALVPMVLIAGGFLSRLSRVQTNPLRPSAAPPPVPWGMAPAMLLLVAAILVSLARTGRAFGLACNELFVLRDEGLPMANRLNTAGIHVKPGERFLMLGNSMSFYFPDDSVYATAFDSEHLVDLLKGTPQQVEDRLRQQRVGYVWGDRSEILRLSNTYGYPESLAGELPARIAASQPADARLLRESGLKLRQLHTEKQFTLYALPWAQVTVTTKPAAAR